MFGGASFVSVYPRNVVQIRRFAPPLVLFYFTDRRLLLVIGGRLFMIWVVFSLQISVAARVLLSDFVFL